MKMFPKITVLIGITASIIIPVYVFQSLIHKSSAQANGSVVIADGENDWYLPEDVTRDPKSGFYGLGLNPEATDAIPIVSNGGWPNWDDLNPSEGVYRFDLIENRLSELEGTDYGLGLRIKASERDSVPDWVVNNYDVTLATLTGGNQNILYVCPFGTDIQNQYDRFLQALKQTSIPNHPNLRFVQIHGFSSSTGEELNLRTTNDFNTMVNRCGMTPQVYETWAKRRIDSWADLMDGREDLLMWAMYQDDALEQSQGDEWGKATERIIDYMIQKGGSFRSGIIELPYTYIPARSLGHSIVYDPNSPIHDSSLYNYPVYWHLDLDHPVVAENRTTGEENEEYWSPGNSGSKWNDTYNQLRFRWRISNLMSLARHININYTTNYAYNLNPEFSDYVLKSMKKTVETSSDAWSDLIEGYRFVYIEEDARWRSVAFKNVERYLYQRDLPQAKTRAVEKFYIDMGASNFWNQKGQESHVKSARRTDRASGNDRMYFNVEDRFIYDTESAILLKVTYKDDNSGTWHVEYDGGNSGVVSTDSVQGTGTGQWKTATFTINNAVFGNNLDHSQDFAIVTETADVTVKFVRIIKIETPLPPPGTPDYEILRVEQTPRINGDISEFDEANVIELSQNGNDHTAEYRMLYNDRALYVAATVSDTQLQSQYAEFDEKLWEDDAVEIMLDTLWDKGDIPQEDDYKFYVNVNNAQRDSNQSQVSWNADGGFTSDVEIKGTINDPSDTDQGYIIELEITWAAMGLQAPNAGSLWGLDIVFDDRDENGTRHSVAWKNKDGDSYNSPDGWGMVKFSADLVSGISQYDLNVDGIIDSDDVKSFLGLWHSFENSGDFTDDGFMNALDYALLQYEVNR